MLTNREIVGIESQWKEVTQDCSIILTTECDKDKNGNITWTEWKSCLGGGVDSGTPIIEKPGRYDNLHA